MQNFGKTARSFAQPVTYMGLAILAVIYATLAYLIAFDRKEAETAAQRRTGNLVRVVEVSFANIFKNADLSLRFLRKLYQQQPSDFDFGDWGRISAMNSETALNVGILDREGRFIESGGAPELVGWIAAIGTFFALT